MKKIEAIIRKSKFDEVKNALHQTGIDLFSFWEVTGVGKARKSRGYRGIAYDTSNIEKVLLSIVVRDINLDRTVKAILKAAKSGVIGVGKIFVSDREESYRIRTEEKGDYALFIKE